MVFMTFTITIIPWFISDEIAWSDGLSVLEILLDPYCEWFTVLLSFSKQTSFLFRIRGWIAIWRQYGSILGHIFYYKFPPWYRCYFKTTDTLGSCRVFHNSPIFRQPEIKLHMRPCKVRKMWPWINLNL